MQADGKDSPAAFYARPHDFVGKRKPWRYGHG
jgi:hypothetical protein